VTWKKVPEAAKEWAGGTSPKTLYAAIRAGRLKAARIGAGRNVLVCEQFVDEWLKASVRAQTLLRGRPETA
jgi:excisionase family DNA binding protein